MYCMLNFIQCSTVCPIFVLIINRYHINDSDSSYCKSSLNAGCLWVSIQQTLENTQQRVRRISTKASVWTSSASQSNIWKQFLSCNNKNTQHPRFQAQHIYIKPHCPLWSGLRKEAYTKIQLGLNVSSQRVHSMTTQVTESPTLARQRVLWGHSQIPQITLALHSDCPLAWKQFCGCRWKREGEGFLRRHMFWNVLFQSWVNVMIISFAWVIVSGLANRFWCWGAEWENKRGSGSMAIVYWITLKGLVE